MSIMNQLVLADFGPLLGLCICVVAHSRKMGIVATFYFGLTFLPLILRKNYINGFLDNKKKDQGWQQLI